MPHNPNNTSGVAEGISSAASAALNAILSPFTVPREQVTVASRPSRPSGPRPVYGPPIPPGFVPPRPARPPRTFTDGQGNIREVGTGNIVRPAPRPARPRPSGGRSPSRPAPRPTGGGGGGGSAPPRRVVTRNGVKGFTGPRTYKHPDGSIRRTAAWSEHLRKQRGGRPTGGGAAKPAKDPITAIVDDIIASMNAPLDQMRVEIDEKARGDVNQHDRLSDFYNRQLSSLQSSAQLDLGAALQRAASLKGISADTVAKNQEWLMSLMGQSGGGAQAEEAAASAQATSSDLAGVNDQIARELSDAGQRLDGFLTSSRAAGHSARREFAEQRMLATEAAQREIDRQIAANRAQAPMLRRQVEAEEREFALKQAVAEREWGLKAAQFESLNNYRAGQLELGAERLEQQGRPKPPAPEKPGRYGNIPARYDAAIQKVYDNLNRPDDPETIDVDESRVVRPWRTAFDELTKSAGLNPTTAALLATRWYPDSITSSNPFSILTLLRNRSVDAGAQKRILDQFFGEGTYTQILRNPAAYMGTMIGNAL